VGFTGTRACDRRLKILVDGGYLSRKKYLYGVPYLYTVTHKGRILIGANKRENKIRLEQINHDVKVLDMLIYFKGKYGFSLDDVESERELHIKDGFGMRKHHPDFVFVYQDKNGATADNVVADDIRYGFKDKDYAVADDKYATETKKYAVEVELTLKAKENLERNIRDNYLNYDHQIWVTSDNKIFNLIQAFADEYANIEVIHMDKMGELI